MSDQENTPLLSENSPQLVPVLPLRDVVVYPHMVIPLFVGREKSIEALDAAMQDNKKILLLAQKNAEVDDPAQEDLYAIGTLSTILQMLKLPDGVPGRDNSVFSFFQSILYIGHMKATRPLRVLRS